DTAFAVVQVGVAHTARLHAHGYLARARIGNHDRLDGYRLPLRLRHHPPYVRSHAFPPYDRTTFGGIPPFNTVATAELASAAMRVRVACDADPIICSKTALAALS